MMYLFVGAMIAMFFLGVVMGFLWSTLHNVDDVLQEIENGSRSDN